MRLCVALHKGGAFMRLCVAFPPKRGTLLSMPRQARIDAPGAIHHIICRGIERRKIFSDDTDRDRFLVRLGRLVRCTRTVCYAWALIPNHFHLLLQTQSVPITTIMHRLLTGYAVEFNRRHSRTGHLFQNRYRSILCQKENYLLDLIRYIHLNPFRAGIVRELTALARYPYSGHRQLMTGSGSDWQETDEVMELFSLTPLLAREKYQAFVAEGAHQGKREDLIGGGLIRSSGGWEEVKDAQKAGIFLWSDERILGDSDFVEEVLYSAQETKLAKKERVVDLPKLAEQVAERAGTDVKDLFKKTKKPEVVKAKSILCYLATRDFGITATALATAMGMSQSAVSRAAERGEIITENDDW